MIRINLLGRDAEQAGGSRFAVPSLGASGQQLAMGAMLVAVLGLIGAAWWYQSRQMGGLRVDLAAAQSERARLEDVAQQVQSLQERTDLISRKLEIIVDLKARQTGPVMLLDQISRRMADGLWLTRLGLDGADVDIRGEALSEVSVADFVDSLEESEYFDQVRLRTLVESGEALSFQITLEFSSTQGSPAMDPAAPAADGG